MIRKFYYCIELLNLWSMEKEKNWSTEKIVSFTAMLVSLTTVIIFIYQTNLLRQQNYISILPYLIVSSTNNEAEYTFEINLENQGVGPAIIESVEIFYKGVRYGLEDYDYRLFDVLSAIQPRMDSVRYFSSSTLERGRALPANTTYNLINVKNAPEDFFLLSNIFVNLLESGMTYRIVYKSILNERWEIRIDSDGPQKLE